MRPTFIDDGNRRPGSVVVFVLWLVAWRKLIQVRLIDIRPVVIAQPQVNVQFRLHCPSALALAFLAGLLLLQKMQITVK